jgi:hypothetical protein
MSTNRSFINDFDIVRPAQLIEKGIPLPGLSGKYTVDEGWVAVITEGGSFKELLKPGTYFANRYRFFRDVKAIEVDTRVQTLTVSTMREFTIQKPVPVEINLDLAVEYRVADARRVALEVKTPLTSLYDRVLQAARGAVSYATVNEIRTQGEGIARATLQRLQAMQLPKIIGVEVFNVLTTSIKATDAGSDALAARQMEEFTRLRDWELEQKTTAQSQVTWAWLLTHRPEVAQRMIETYGMMAKEMIDKGLLDPAGFMNQPLEGPTQMNPMNLLGTFGMSNATLPGGQPNQPQLTDQAGSGQNMQGTPDIHARIREEIEYLKGLPGAKVEARAGVDGDGVPDGSYSLRISLPRSSGGQVALYFTCPPGYPSQAPEVEAEVNGSMTPFQSATLRHWQGQYLVEIAREARQWFG